MFRLATNQTSRNLFSGYARSHVRVSLSSKQTTGTQIVPNTDAVFNEIENGSLIKESFDTIQLIHSSKPPTRKLVVDTKKQRTEGNFLSLIHSSVKYLRSHRISSASILIDDFPIEGVDQSLQIDHLTRAALLSGYEFSKYKKPTVCK